MLREEARSATLLFRARTSKRLTRFACTNILDRVLHAIMHYFALHLTVIAVVEGYTNLGSGVCTSRGRRAPYSQLNFKGDVRHCKAECDKQSECLAYNPDTHNDWCFLFFRKSQPLTDSGWKNLRKHNNDNNGGAITSQDGGEGGTCFAKEQG